MTHPLLQQPEVMLDLETMSVRPDAAIVAIGAVAFDRTDPSRTWPTFYERVDLSSSMAAGGAVDGATVRWWLQQSESARAEVSARDAAHIAAVLSLFSAWIDSLGDRAKVLMWGNGADFDNVVLRSAYERLMLEAPWSWWNNRCFRTLRKERPEVAEPPQAAGHVEHHALDDARQQVEHLLAIHDAARPF